MIKTKFSRFGAMFIALVMALSINVIASSNSITFIVTGDSIHNEGEHNSYQEWINTSYELNGENIGEILENVLTQKGYDCDYSIGEWGGYLNSITTPEGSMLGAYTNGSKSGWLTKVNSEIPDLSMDNVYPSNGDIVEIFYIDDYEAEIYGYYSTFNLNPENTNLTVYDSNGNVVEPSWGAYSLFNGKYNYSASAEGYITQTGDFTVSGAGVNIDITLEREIGNTTESTTESTTKEAVDTGSEWGLFRKDSTNNPIVRAETPSKENAEVKWATKIKEGWSPFAGLALTDDAIYTGADSYIYKINKNTGKIIESKRLEAAIGYTYFIAYSEGKVFIQLGDGRIEAFDSNLNKLWISENPDIESNGQGLSPIYCNEGKVYCGTVSTTGGQGYYYCLDADTGDYIWKIKGEKGSYNGFYWSGCIQIGDYIVVGGESGKLYMIDKEGNVADSYRVSDDIRSSIAYSNGFVYFTDKSGYLHSVGIEKGRFTEGKSVIINENATTSTSTPAIYDGKIYVGAGGMYPKGYFSVFDTELNQLYTAEVEGNVQSSPLIGVNGDDVRVYFTCNGEKGNLKIYDNECNDLIDLKDYKNYCGHSPIADDNGVIYYQNDSGYVVAVGSSEITDKTTENTTEGNTETTTYSNGGSSEDGNIRVNFNITGESNWISAYDISMPSGSSVADLIKKVFNEYGIECDGLEENYIKSVTYKGITLAEFDKGPNSGWMYKVNGEYYNTAICNYKLSYGDNVELVYVEDYTNTDNNNSNLGGGSGGSAGGGDSSSKTTVTTVTTEETTEVTTEEYKDEVYITAVNGSHKFSDISENHWAYEGVTYLYNKGIVKGRTDEEFAPNDNVTRAEFVAMIYRLSSGSNKYNCKFNDVSKDSWYYNAVAWAFENGIVSGIDEMSFEPERKITRQDIACIIKRYADKFDIALNENVKYVGFDDESEISGYAFESIKSLYKSEIIKGNDKGKFMPKAFATRGEAAVMIYNLIK